MRCLLILGALALAACQPVVVAPASAPVAPVAAPSAGSGLTGATLIDEKLLVAAETAYNVPAHAYVTADGNKQLSPALKARVKPLLQSAYRALKLARASYAVGDASGFNRQFAALKSFANQAKALLPAAK